MGFTPNARRIACLAIVPLTVSAWIIGTSLHTGRAVRAGQTAPPVARTIPLGAAQADAAYAVTISVKDPGQIQKTDAVHVTVNDGKGEIESKWLHVADLDFYLTLRPREAGPVTVNLTAAPTAHIPDIAALMTPIPDRSVGTDSSASQNRGVIAAAPNGTWQTAQQFELGQTIFGSD